METGLGKASARWLAISLTAIFPLLAVSVIATRPALPIYGVPARIPTETQSTGWIGSSSPYSIFGVETNPQGDVWQINDTITLTAGEVDWTEVRYHPKPAPVVSLGYWYEFHQRENFVNFNDIFVDLEERFNWEMVNRDFIGFDSWEVFVENVTSDPSWWLEWSWNLKSDWYGISPNKTAVQLEKEGTDVTVRIWCHVTNVAEYLIGHSFGVYGVFDLYSVSLGRMGAYEYYYDATDSDRSVYVHFTAPSTILRQEGDTYTATIKISPLKQHTPSKYNRNIIVTMPPGTELKKISPTEIGSFTRDLATFTLAKNKEMPEGFMVTSGPHVKGTTEILVEGLTSEWGIAAIIGLITGLSSGMQGVRIWRRRRTYNRMVRLMVRIYDEYSSDPDRLTQEMANLTHSIMRLFIDNKITDDQFERLLARRDDFLQRISS
ncbi:MAG: hypothetical protein ACE5Z5_06480 [Candidatus Bathyarchaeia archaeon]